MKATPPRTAAVKAAVLAAIRADKQLKELAVDVRLAHTEVCRLAHAFGYRRAYVTDAERALLLTQRAREDAESAKSNQAA